MNALKSQDNVLQPEVELTRASESHFPDRRVEGQGYIYSPRITHRAGR